ncbi:MAG: hypothetical protein JSW55_00790 [Chloroflexota bacterium]|nr:MAG: hypothetical protein JSW55_00790 [Chloroflexota bacterium]
MIDAGQYRAVWLLAVVLLPMAACLFVLGVNSDSGNALVGTAVALAALVLGSLAFAVYKLKHKNEIATTEARIVKRYKEKQPARVTGGGSEPLGMFLEVLALGLMEAKPPHEHFLEFEFSPAEASGVRPKMALKASVTKEVYDRCMFGSVVSVKFAVEDPLIAVLEGERGYGQVEDVEVNEEVPWATALEAESGQIELEHTLDEQPWHEPELGTYPESTSESSAIGKALDSLLGPKEPTMSRRPGPDTGGDSPMYRAGSKTSPAYAGDKTPASGLVDSKSTADGYDGQRQEAEREPARPGGAEASEDGYDLGILAGIVSGLLASVFSIFWSMQTMFGFTENAPVVCVPLAAVYSIPLGIGGAKIFRRIGVDESGSPARDYAYVGAVFGGAVAFLVSVFVMKFIELLGY